MRYLDTDTKFGMRSRRGANLSEL